MDITRVYSEVPPWAAIGRQVWVTNGAYRRQYRVVATSNRGLIEVERPGVRFETCVDDVTPVVDNLRW